VPGPQEWLSFGHQFALRHGSAVHSSQSADASPGSHSPKQGVEDQQSPVFVQFVDAVWQLTLQHPRAFEFNQRFLATVLDHLFSGRFGTFLLDNHSVRSHDQIATVTRSLWSELLDRPADKGLVNPFYLPTQSVLSLDTSGSRLEVFKAFYCRGAWVVDPSDFRGLAEAALLAGAGGTAGGGSSAYAR